MTLSAYGKSITASLLIHLLAIAVIAEWGVARGRNETMAIDAISVRLEAGPRAGNKKSNAVIKNTEIKQHHVARKTKDTELTKAPPMPEPQALEVEQLIIESKEQALYMPPPGYSELKTGEATPSYTGNNEGPEGESAWRPVLIGRIRAAIQGAVYYPPLARKRGLEGTVLAGFSIDGSGLPRDIKVIRSSGHGILDREVKRIIKKASPYPPLDGTVEVPVSFRLRD